MLTTGAGQSILRPPDVQSLVIVPLTEAAVSTRTTTVVHTDSTSTRFPVLLADPENSWTQEASEINISESQLEEIVCTPGKLASVVPISNELHDDSDPAALDVVGQGLVRDLQIKLDAAFFANVTANGPDGLLSLTDVQVGQHRDNRQSGHLCRGIVIGRERRRGDYLVRRKSD